MARQKESFSRGKSCVGSARFHSVFALLLNLASGWPSSFKKCFLPFHKSKPCEVKSLAPHAPTSNGMIDELERMLKFASCNKILRVSPTYLLSSPAGFMESKSSRMES